MNINDDTGWFGSSRASSGGQSGRRLGFAIYILRLASRRPTDRPSQLRARSVQPQEIHE